LPDPNKVGFDTSEQQHSFGFVDCDDINMNVTAPRRAALGGFATAMNAHSNTQCPMHRVRRSLATALQIATATTPSAQCDVLVEKAGK
jgi:hypothetical protein